MRPAATAVIVRSYKHAGQRRAKTRRRDNAHGARTHAARGRRRHAIASDTQSRAARARKRHVNAGQHRCPASYEHYGAFRDMKRRKTRERLSQTTPVSPSVARHRCRPCPGACVQTPVSASANTQSESQSQSQTQSTRTRRQTGAKVVVAVAGLAIDAYAQANSHVRRKMRQTSRQRHRSPERRPLVRLQTQCHFSFEAHESNWRVPTARWSRGGARSP